MLGWETFGRPNKRGALELNECLADRGLLQQLSKLCVVVEEPVADLRELVFLGHVSAGGDDDLLRADMEVVARAGGLLQALVRPPSGDVGL